VQYEVEVNGRLRQVAVRRENGRFAVTLDGREWRLDAARIDGHLWSLLIDADFRLTSEAGASPSRLPDAAPASPRTASFEVSMAADPGTGDLAVRVGGTTLAVSVNGRRRWSRKDDSALAGSGPQRLVAPMPGKIARVLVKTGEAVLARQPLIVIEAMKMENELRAGGDGTVAEIHVRDGQSVDAGALLAVIHR
jgi:biotin carboxyl carrier protein